MSIRFESVYKQYGSVTAVADLNLRSDEGEMLALLGPSGCGKSTTLKMLAGIEAPSSGDIWIKDRSVVGLPPNQRNIAMVFEDYALYPHMSAFQNITYPLKVRGYGKREIQERAAKIIKLLDLGDLVDRNVTKLSGGAQQRISIGRALIRDPDLILFDEPLSHLDADQKAELRSEIKHLQKTVGVTSILVTHDQTEAIAMSDRVAVMNHGVIQQVDDPLVLYNHPANIFVATFIGEPSMNVVPVEFLQSGAKSHLRCVLFEFELSAGLADFLRTHADGKELLLGMRPEHVRKHHSRHARTNEIEAVIANREPRGDTDVLTLKLLGNESTMRIQIEARADSSNAVDSKCVIEFPEERMHFFSEETGRNIVRGAEGAV